MICNPHKGNWTTALSNEIGRLAQGVEKRIKGTNTIFFIHWSGVPEGKRVTYGQIFMSIRHNKSETHQVKIIVGDDKP